MYSYILYMWIFELQAMSYDFIWIKLYANIENNIGSV